MSINKNLEKFAAGRFSGDEKTERANVELLHSKTKERHDAAREKITSTLKAERKRLDAIKNLGDFSDLSRSDLETLLAKIEEGISRLAELKQIDSRLFDKISFGQGKQVEETEVLSALFQKLTEKKNGINDILEKTIAA